MEQPKLMMGIGEELKNELEEKRAAERILAERMVRTFSENKFDNIKDIYDIYVILNNFEISSDTLTKLLDEAGFKMGPETPFGFAEMITWKDLWKYYELKDSEGRSIEKPEVFEMLKVYAKFIIWYIEIIQSDEEVSMVWRAENTDWI